MATVMGEGRLARGLRQTAMPGVWCAPSLSTAADEDDAANALQLVRQGLELASRSGDTLHLVSSMAIAGAMTEPLREKHFDEGQDLDTLLARAAFDQERVVREECAAPWRIYRTAWILDGSDDLDGPALFFRALEMTALIGRRSWTLYGPDFGRTDVVPLSFVTAALSALSQLADGDGQTFHLGSGAGFRTADVHNAFADLCDAPRAQILEDGLGALAHSTYRGFMQSPRWSRQRAWLFRELGIPSEAILRLSFECDFDCTETAELLAARGITCPPLHDYAPLVWRDWTQRLRPLAWSA